MGRLMTHFAEIKRRRPSSNPMHFIIAFAIFSTRRLEEITRVKWADFDNEGNRVLVRDMKTPGEWEAEHLFSHALASNCTTRF
jgi:hypothetical protein